jgi:hypothetical protein
MKTGKEGEEYVYRYEYNKLKDLGRIDLANKIVKQYEDLSSFPGYDLKSYDESGEEIFIEVKSTNKKEKKGFDITANEWKNAQKLGDKYFIYLVMQAQVESKRKITAKIRNPYKVVENGKMLCKTTNYRIEYT